MNRKKTRNRYWQHTRWEPQRVNAKVADAELTDAELARLAEQYPPPPEWYEEDWTEHEGNG